MKHVKALIIKFVASFVLLYIILGLMYEMTFGEVLALTTVLGVAAYLLGDLLILPRTNNTIATIADFGLALMIIYWFVDGMTVADNPFTVSLIAALGVGVVELFFHRYLANNILPGDIDSPGNRGLNYQTEASEEFVDIVPDEEDNHRNKND